MRPLSLDALECVTVSASAQRPSVDLTCIGHVRGFLLRVSLFARHDSRGEGDGAERPIEAARRGVVFLTLDRASGRPDRSPRPVEEAAMSGCEIDVWSRTPMVSMRKRAEDRRRGSPIGGPAG
jgi:hypothetical protein